MVCSPLTEGQVQPQSLRKLYIALVLCFLFMLAELIGGLLSGSLAIISDAVHLLSDLASLITSIISIKISHLKPSDSMSFGYQRAQTLGALISIALVWLLTGFLLFEGFHRVKHPQPINAKLMFFTALIGLFINFILAFVLTHSHHSQHENHPNNPTLSHNHDINLKAALVHVIGDMIQSVGVLVASVIIWHNQEWVIADSICTLLFSLIVFGSTWFVLREIVTILMEGTPLHLKITQIEADIESIDKIIRVHDLHVWTLSPGNLALTVHAVIGPANSAAQDIIMIAIQDLICEKYQIYHSTIQLEPVESDHCNHITCKKK